MPRQTVDMNNDFRIMPLPATLFAGYFTMSERELKEQNAALVPVTSHPGYPCRVSLQDAEIGETVLLTEYTHHRAATPYRSSGAIFVRQLAQPAELGVNEIPEMLLRRLLSVRAYDSAGFMKDASAVEGPDLEVALANLFARPEIRRVDIHNAGAGCFNCRALRERDPSEADAM